MQYCTRVAQAELKTGLAIDQSDLVGAQTVCSSILNTPRLLVVGA